LIAELCFRRLYNYDTAVKAFKTLFYASFGDFSFNEVENAEQGQYFGITFMVLFLIFNIGLMMSLFIAIITVLFDALAGNRHIYFMLETLKVRPQTEANKEYSALISLPIPFNALNFLFTPFLLTSKNPERLNVMILFIGYAPILLVSTILFIAYNIALLPLTYVKLVFHKSFMIFVYSKSFRVSRADKFMNFVQFAVFGPFILIINIITDIKYFIRHMLRMDLLKTKHQTNDH